MSSRVTRNADRRRGATARRQRAESTAATRRAILDAAIALFREEGEPDPSLERVAARAGCSTRSVIRHFGSKEGLLEAAIADAIGDGGRVAPGRAGRRRRRRAPAGRPLRADGRRSRPLAAPAAERYPLVRRVTEDGDADAPRADRRRLRARPRAASTAASAGGASPPSRPSPTSTSGTCCAAAKGSAAAPTEAEIRNLVEAARTRRGGRGSGAVRVLAYTSPARGHLNPMMGPLLELRRRGAEVHVRTLASQVEAVRAAGLECEPLDPAIEAIPHGDHDARNQIEAGLRSFADLRRPRPARPAPTSRPPSPPPSPTWRWSTSPPSAPRRSPSGSACAGPSRGPSCSKSRRPGVPPFGLGLRPLGGPAGRAPRRRARPRRPRLRPQGAAAGAERGPPRRPGCRRWRPATSATAPRSPSTSPPSPSSTSGRCRRGCVMVGAGEWDTAADADGRAARGRAAAGAGRLLLGVPGRRRDRRRRPRRPRATAGAWSSPPPASTRRPSATPATPSSPASSPTARCCAQADVVVCHGGMGITQKALAAGVPVCVVPWGRDQLEVAAHVVAAGAGTRVARRRLTPQRLAAAVERAAPAGPAPPASAPASRRPAAPPPRPTRWKRSSPPRPPDRRARSRPTAASGLPAGYLGSPLTNRPTEGSPGCASSSSGGPRRG